ncbi:MAG: WGxxGxxG family protein [Gemmatimonadaceae bacterium]
MIRLLRVGIVAASVALLLASVPLTADGQAGGAGTTTGAQTTDAPRQDDDGFDPGWFGLLGLAGLFGLRRPREERTTRVDTTTGTRRP